METNRRFPTKTSYSDLTIRWLFMAAGVLGWLGIGIAILIWLYMIAAKELRKGEVSRDEGTISFSPERK